MATPNAAARNATKPLALTEPALLGELDDAGAPLLVPDPALFVPVALDAGSVVEATSAVANAPDPVSTVLGYTTVAADDACARYLSNVLPVAARTAFRRHCSLSLVTQSQKSSISSSMSCPFASGSKR